jgi:hypothetical protein
MANSWLLGFLAQLDSRTLNSFERPIWAKLGNRGQPNTYIFKIIPIYNHKPWRYNGNVDKFKARKAGTVK